MATKTTAERISDKMSGLYADVAVVESDEGRSLLVRKGLATVDIKLHVAGVTRTARTESGFQDVQAKLERETNMSESERAIRVAAGTHKAMLTKAIEARVKALVAGDESPTDSDTAVEASPLDAAVELAAQSIVNNLELSA